jgi:hypothetical protein
MTAMTPYNEMTPAAAALHLLALHKLPGDAYKNPVLVHKVDHAARAVGHYHSVSAARVTVETQPRSSLAPFCAHCADDVYVTGSGTVHRVGITLDAESAAHCEMSADHLHSLPVDPPEHVCLEGPVCVWWDAAASSRSYDDDAGWCGHESCLEAVMHPCEACQIETAIGMAADVTRWAQLSVSLDAGQCPGPDGVSCGAAVTYRAAIAAPGYGRSYECSAGHMWVKIGPTWTDTPGELTVADVI